MVEALNALVEWMLSIPALHVYLVILAISYAENIIPIVPGDVLVVLGGYMAGLGMLDAALVVVISTVGGVLGFMTVYLVGYRLGDAVFDTHRLRWIPKREVRRVRAWLHRWGYGVVVANRFLSGARSVVSLSVGIARMNPWQISFYAIVGGLLWSTLLVLSGLFVGRNWEVVIEYLEAYGQIVLVVLILVIGYLVVRRRRRRRLRQNQAALG